MDSAPSQDLLDQLARLAPAGCPSYVRLSTDEEIAASYLRVSEVNCFHQDERGCLGGRSALMTPSQSNCAWLAAWQARNPDTYLQVTLSPNTLTSLEGCEAELVAALGEIDRQVAAGTFAPVPLAEMDI